jgi:hypothetical protein
MSTGLYSRLDQGLRGEWLGPQGRVNGMSLGYLTWLQLAVAGLGGSFSSMITPSFKKPGHDDLSRPVTYMGEASKGVTMQVAFHRAGLGAAGSRGAYGYPGFCRCPR